MDKKPFNQREYNYNWDKENMATVNAKYKKDFVNEFKAACKVLEISQSQAIKKSMQKIIDEANKKSGK
ncbi:MAG: hypothetical protein ACK5KQ_01255 [Anaerorhabdus sp.]